MTYYGDSYGGVMSAELQDKNARAARSQDAMRLIMGLRQHHQINKAAEKQFQATQEQTIARLAQQQRQFDEQKALDIKGLEADASKLEFEKEKANFATQRAAELLKFDQDQLKADQQFNVDQGKKDEAETMYEQVRRMGVAVDPYDADQLFGGIIDPKRKDLLVRETTGKYQEQKKKFDMAAGIANLLNAQSELKQKTDEYAKNETFYGKHISKADERKANETNLLRLKELKSRTAGWLDPSGELSKRAMPLITVDENGLYVPLVQQPKTFRELNPDQSQGLGRVRSMEREEPEPTDFPPQSYDEATGAVGLPFTPRMNSMPMQDTSSGNLMMDAGLLAPQGVDPREALVAEFIARGIPPRQAVVMADNAMQGQGLQQQFSAGRYRP